MGIHYAKDVNLQKGVLNFRATHPGNMAFTLNRMRAKSEYGPADYKMLGTYVINFGARVTAISVVR